MSNSLTIGSIVATLDGDRAELASEADMMPQPLVWPACDVCLAAYQLTLPLFVFNGPRRWSWTRGCDKPRSTCKGAGFTLNDAEGPVPDGGR